MVCLLVGLKPTSKQCFSLARPLMTGVFTSDATAFALVMEQPKPGQLLTSLILALAIVSFCALGAHSRAELRRAKTQWVVNDDEKPLYLPKLQHVTAFTLGFKNVAADILWFSTLNYFGKQYQAQKDFRWLSHMCHLVTSLDPKAEHVYEFCAVLLSWMAHKPDKSNEILLKANQEFPYNWRFHYLRGFNQWYFLENKPAAVEALTTAANLPQAPAFLSSLASRLMVETDSPQTAIDFLSLQLQRANDQEVKRALQDKLDRAVLARDIAFLNEALRRYEQKVGQRAEELEDLVTEEIINKLPSEPFGGSYFLQIDSYKVSTTSGEEPLKFAGKTATTGAFREEFTNREERKR